MEKYSLGEFEEVVMLTVAALHTNAYGVAIQADIEQRLNRKVSVGAMRTALIEFGNSLQFGKIFTNL